jgi:hypothetical protein
MSRPVHTIEIDRIVLTDLGVTPDRVELIGTLTAQKLRSLLERQGTAEHLESSDVPYLLGPTMQLADLNSDERVATSVARSIAQALRSSTDRIRP